MFQFCLFLKEKEVMFIFSVNVTDTCQEASPEHMKESLINCVSLSLVLHHTTAPYVTNILFQSNGQALSNMSDNIIKNLIF